MKQTSNNKKKIFCGGNGSGKTLSAIKELGKRPFITMNACDITLDDIYSYPKNHGVLIEEVNYKPEKEKILKILLSLDHVVLTSLNEKDVPKSIMNLCTRKRCGQQDKRQDKIRKVAPNAEVIKKYEKSVYELTYEYLKNSNRDEVLEYMKYNKPADLQILSWIQPNVDINNIVKADEIMRMWSMDYFYAILTYGFDGGHSGKLQFPKRNSYSPVAKICSKLGLKKKDSHLVKLLLQEEQYKMWATKILNSDECKILGLKKPRKKTIRLVNTKLGDW